MIGNSLPLEEGINNSCDDKMLNVKVEKYKQSVYSSVKEFRKLLEQKGDGLWENDDIDKREKIARALYDM